jgi:hypothetical protein
MMTYIITIGTLLFNKNIPISTTILMAIFSISSNVSTFVYLRKLRKDKCECSSEYIRDIYYYYYFVVVVMNCVLLSLFALLFLTATIYK